MIDLVIVGVAVAMAGFLVIFLATVLASRSEAQDEEGKGARVKGGGVIMIGPIPIVFGTDAKWTVIAMVLAILLIVLSIFLTQVT